MWGGNVNSKRFKEHQMEKPKYGCQRDLQYTN